MAIAFQSVDSNQITTGATSHTINITTPAANELIVFAYSKNFPPSADPTVQDQNGDNFTKAVWDYADVAHGGIYYKIADGDETSVVITYGDASEGEGVVAVYSGIDTSDTLEDAQFTTTYATDFDTATATTTNSSGLAVYLGAVDQSRRYDSADNVSMSSATVRNDLTRTNADPGCVFGDQVYSSSGTYSTTISTDALSNTEVLGATVLFNEATGGGVTASPFGHQKLDNQYATIAASRLNGVLQ